MHFAVDVSEAGKGELMVTISNGLHELPVRLEQDGSMFTIFTIADAVGDYFVNILWDRSPVTGMQTLCRSKKCLRSKSVRCANPTTRHACSITLGLLFFVVTCV